MSFEDRRVLTVAALIADEGGSIKTGPFGTTLKASEYVTEGEPLISVREIGQGTFHVDAKTPRVSGETRMRLPEYVLAEGDIVFARKGGIERCALIKKEQAGWFLGSDGIRLRPPKSCDARFLAYSLQTKAIKDWLRQNSTGSTMASLNQSTIGRLPIALPRIEEQVKAADTLEALDDRIALLRETNATLEAIAQALFKSWFVDFDPVRARMEGRPPEGMDDATAALFPDSFEESELGLVPKGWQLGTVGQFANVTDCLHAKKPELRETGRPFLQLNNIRDDGLLDTSSLSYVSEIDYRKWISRIEVSEGDCVITNVGRVGAVAQIPSSLKAAMGRNMTAIRTKNDWPYPTFLIELLQSKVMRAEIERRTDIGTILNALNVRNIPLLRCVLPPKAILAVFELTARPLRAAMEANLDRATSLATLRDTLLPRLISGQLRLPDAEAMAPETA
jgi:type I restriction enzyme S subunit